MKLSATAALVAVSCAFAFNAHAQAPTKAAAQVAPPAAAVPAPAPAAPVTVTPEQRAAIKDLLEITKTRENLGRTFQAMSQGLPAQMAQAMNRQIEEASITPEQKAKVRANMNEPFANAIKEGTAIINDPKNADQALDKMYPIYAKYFTTDEIKQIVAFYKTPTGAKTLTAMPQVINETMQTGIAIFQPKLNAVMEKTVKTQIDAVANAKK